MKPEKFSWKKRAKSFTYAGKGIRTLIKYEHNARIHTVAAIAVILAAWLLGCDAVEWSILIICIGMVFSAEAVNSAVEALADRLASPRASSSSSSRASSSTSSPSSSDFSSSDFSDSSDNSDFQIDSRFGGVFDPLIGRAKDLAAGAVLLIAIAAAAVGLIILLPRLLTLFV